MPNPRGGKLLPPRPPPKCSPVGTFHYILQNITCWNSLLTGSEIGSWKQWVSNCRCWYMYTEHGSRSQKNWMPVSFWLYLILHSLFNYNNSLCALHVALCLLPCTHTLSQTPLTLPSTTHTIPTHTLLTHTLLTHTHTHTHTGYLSWSRNAAICAGIAATVRIIDSQGQPLHSSVSSDSIVTGGRVWECGEVWGVWGSVDRCGGAWRSVGTVGSVRN